MAWRKLVRRALFGRYLLVTNTVVSGLLDAVGDVLEQRLERVSPHDTPRTLRMGTVGLMLGPVDHFWYRFLDSRMPGRRSSTVAKKVAVDTIIFGPVAIVFFYMSESGTLASPPPPPGAHCTFITSTGMCKLEGRTWKKSMQETRDKFVTTFEVS